MVCADFYADFYCIVRRTVYPVKFAIDHGFVCSIAIFTGMAGTGV